MSVIRDVFDVIRDLSNYDEIEFLKNKPKGSLTRMTKDAVLQFPVIASRSVDIQLTQLIVKSLEKNFGSLMKIAFTLNSITDEKDLSNYIRQFHQNIGSDRDHVTNVMIDYAMKESTVKYDVRGDLTESQMVIIQDILSKDNHRLLREYLSEINTGRLNTLSEARGFNGNGPVRNGQTIYNGDTASQGLGYRMILDTDVDQQVFDKLYFNRWRKPMPDTALSNARGYVLISRPDTNIVGPNGQLNAGMVDSTIQAMAATHPDALRMLCHDSCPEYGAFFPVMTNACQGYDVPDVTLKTQEFGETFRGWKAAYGRHTVDSRTLYSFSLSFEDNREGTIYNTIRAWVQYIESINYGLINTKEKYIRERVVDYMASVYFLVVAEDGETLLFWSKDTGVFPTSIPSSAYSMDKDGTRGPLKLSVQFMAMVHEEMNPAILSDLNDISKLQSAVPSLNSSNDYKVNVESPVSNVGTTWVNRPIVVFDNGKFKLKWTEITKK